jgi:hypothetical protein
MGSWAKKDRDGQFSRAESLAVFYKILLLTEIENICITLQYKAKQEDTFLKYLPVFSADKLSVFS